MTTRDELVQQTRYAFDFIERLYMEVSYLIREMEGHLRDEPEKFAICKPTGYGVTTRSSTGLESANVSMWLPRRLAVSFIPSEHTEESRGKTHTPSTSDLKTLYVRILLDDKSIEQPMICSGVLYDLQRKTPGKGWDRFVENLMAHIEYNEHRVFVDAEKLEYEDAYVKFQGCLQTVPLYEIADSASLVSKVIEPSLELFRTV